MSLIPSLNQDVITELISTIEKQRPASLVYCTKEPIAAIDKLAEQRCAVAHARTLAVLEAESRYELGIVFDLLEHCSPDEGIKILCRLRNFSCDRVWAAVTTSEQWNLNTMISLGFKREYCYGAAEGEICSYSYDLGSYNHKREWNTPRFWANPENWGKYRW